MDAGTHATVTSIPVVDGIVVTTILTLERVNCCFDFWKRFSRIKIVADAVT